MKDSLGGEMPQDLLGRREGGDCCLRGVVLEDVVGPNKV